MFDSKDSCRKIFFKFRCLESQKIGILVPKYGIRVPQKKTDTYSSVDINVHERKPLPYKTAGELFFPPNLHLLTIIGIFFVPNLHLKKGVPSKLVIPTEIPTALFDGTVDGLVVLVTKAMLNG